MKTLIIYATKYGATKKISEIIAEHMGNTVLQDINSDFSASISDFDCIILGSSLTAGMINKKIKSFAAEHTEELKAKRVGLFVSGLQASEEAEYLKQNFPCELLEKAKDKAFLGGIFDPKKCGFLARVIIKAVAKLDSYTSAIDEERIKAFVSQLTI